MVHPDIWVMCAERAMEAYNLCGVSVVADDLRFRNEAEMIRRLGGVTVKIVRPDWMPPEGHVGIKGHASEGGLEDWDFDFTISIPEGMDAINAAADAFVKED